MKRRMAVIFLAVLLLTGCTPLLDREYRVQELHSNKYLEGDNIEILRAESYQDMVNDLLLLVGERKEQAIVRLYADGQKVKIADLLEKAAAEVKNDTPLGAYAVGYITTESTYAHDYYEVIVRIGYRRSREQMAALMNTTSTAALEDLLDSATETGRTELAVLIGYWDPADEDTVLEAMRAAEEKWKLTGIREWEATYYPSAEDAGLIEFRLESIPQLPKPPVEPEEPEDPTRQEQPPEGELPVEGELPPEGETPVEGEPSVPDDDAADGDTETAEPPAETVSENF